MDYHKVPEEWGEEARRFKNHICDAVITSTYVLVNVRPAYKGSWRIGYSWSGSFVLSVWNKKPDGRYCAGQQFKIYLPANQATAQRVEKWWRKVHTKLDTEARGIAVVALYRDSGLIPRHIAKKHGKVIRAKLTHSPDYYKDQETVNMAIKLAYRYITRYGVCPKCKAKKTLMEHIVGYVCTRCGANWDDMDLTNMHWS